MTTHIISISRWQLWATKSLTFNYVMPAVNAQGYSYPNVVSQDFPMNRIDIVVTNTAVEAGNSIYWVT